MFQQKSNLSVVLFYERLYFLKCHQPTTIWSALLLWHNHPVITGADNKCCTGVNNIGVSCDILEEVFFF